MGRELRRVPLDFDWPLNKVWKGFVNPHYKPCPADQKTCFNGETAAAQWLESICRLMCVAADDAHRNLPRQNVNMNVPHPYMTEFPQAPRYEVPQHKKDEFDKLEGSARMTAYYRYMESIPNHERVVRPSKDFLELMNGLMGKDAPDGSGPFNDYFGKSYLLYFRLIKAAGLKKKEWGVCPVCKGDKLDPAAKEVYDAWKNYDPPEGPGYQLWETVSEGSPISPVFSTKEEFIAYLVSQGYSQKASENFSESGWAPSMVTSNGVMYQDIESAALADPSGSK
jgi:hypothetical protein